MPCPIHIYPSKPQAYRLSSSKFLLLFRITYLDFYELSTRLSHILLTAKMPNLLILKKSIFYKIYKMEEQMFHIKVSTMLYAVTTIMYQHYALNFDSTGSGDLVQDPIITLSPSLSLTCHFKVIRLKIKYPREKLSGFAIMVSLEFQIRFLAKFGSRAIYLKSREFFFNSIV